MRTIIIILAMAVSAAGADKFLGWQSCSTTGCHGGGSGDDQVLTWQKLDRHSRAYGTLISERSKRIADALKIAEPAKSAQCTVCHSPMESAAPERIAKNLKAPNHGVSCEACHGPAENYLRFHTRPDVTAAQRVAAGLRDLDSSHARANSCVGCHGNIGAELLTAGHPTLRFELARQLVEMPPHWKDFDQQQSAQAWLVSQAVLLRELCWQAAKNPGTARRIEALHWILRESADGAAHLPPTVEPGPLRTSADTLAKAASAVKWNTAKTRAQFDRTAALASQVKDAAAFSRAEALVPALRALTLGLGKDAAAKAKTQLIALDLAIRSPATFDAQKFAGAVADLASVVATRP